ncbi:MAG TPA: hypothetical protein VN700_14735 [Vicinamibacterales bacterium]|nr:hypothetical protein [Vicinamibacterales bacterium]
MHEILGIRPASSQGKCVAKERQSVKAVQLGEGLLPAPCQFSQQLTIASSLAIAWHT